jgi:hypothetical protein
MRHPLQIPRLRGDFNGLFGDLLCLSHTDTCTDEAGATVELKEGMIVTAFDMDEDDDGKRNDLIATGVVQRSPDWLNCHGSRWSLQIDENGVRHESDIEKPVQL